MGNIKVSVSSLILLFVFAAFQLKAQELKPTARQLKLMKQADKKFEEKGYTSAIDLYGQALALNNAKHALDAKSTYAANLNLAHSYRLTGNTYKAEQYYAKAVEANPAVAQNIFYYARMLQANKKYDEAKKRFEEYAQKMPSDKKGNEFAEVSGRIMGGDFVSKSFTVQVAQFNSPESDFSAAYYRNGLVFASTRGKGSNASERSEWSGENFSDLYLVIPGDRGQMDNVTKFASKLNTSLNEGAGAFSKDFNEMFFTRNRKPNKGEKGVTKMSKLSIYSAINKDGNWQNAGPLPFTHPDYNFAHPSLSADGKTLYFSSDMPGGQGGMDIWKVERSATGWLKPENLGTSINTSENEVFPYMNENTLYFASNGHAGLGGLDVFSVKWENASFGKVINLKQPINSSNDDFGFISDRNGETGYFTSNRSGNDDIFTFNRSGGSSVERSGKITDKISGQPIQGAKVELLGNNASKGEVYITDDAGLFYFEATSTLVYDLKVSKEMYVEQKLTGINLNDALNLQLAPKEIAKGVVTDKITGKPIEGARVELLGSFENKGEIAMTTNTGEFSFEVLKESPYELKISKDSYTVETIPAAEIHKLRKDKSTQINVQMSLEQAPSFSNINFDKDKWIILPKGREVLDSVLVYMKANNQSAIEISSFTDSKGSELYNLGLSVKRADAAVKYLTENGIPKARIYTNFYGDQVLAAKCDNDPACIERERKENRRIELKVLAADRGTASK